MTKVNVASLLFSLFFSLTFIKNVNSSLFRRNKNLRSNENSDSTLPADPNDAIRTTNDDVIIVDDNDEYMNSTEISRHLQGSRTILPLRVTVSGIGAPSVSKDEIYLRVFSDGNSFKHQMARCSAGVLQFNPTNWGVMDVYVNANRGTSRADIISRASSAALSSVGNGYTDVRQIAHHVMFIMPDMNDGYVGSAEVCNVGLSCTSQFGDKHGVSLTVLMHELGHNLGLKHAAGSGSEYGDKTSGMGVSSVEIGGPLACYNGANHWYLGWFTDGRLDLSSVPSNPITVKIPAFVDYSETAYASDQYVLVKAGNFYMQFNRAKDYNMGARAMPDQLVITWDGNPGPSGTTQLVTALDMSNSYYTDKSTVSIQVCNVVMNGSVDYMVVSIGQRSTNCQASTYSAAAAQPRPAPAPVARSRSSTTGSTRGSWSSWNSWK
jgi:hypothetical protein